MKKIQLLKSPLSGYWLIQGGDDFKTIFLEVKTLKAAYNRAKQNGYCHFKTISTEYILLQPISK